MYFLLLNLTMLTIHQTLYDYNLTYFDKKLVTLVNRLGSGYVGEVYEGTLNLNNSCIDIVIKKLTSLSYNKGKHDEYLYNDVIDEVKIASRFMETSERLIRFYGYSSCETPEETCYYLLMEHTGVKGDLGKYIYDDSNWIKLTKQEYDTMNTVTMLHHNDSYWDYIMSTKEKIHIIHQMCLAVKELHNYNIVHCDLKPQNMLYVNEQIKLIDFNASVYMGNETVIKGRTEQGTPGYMAKELYKGHISYTSDIYSLGVSFLEVWFGDIWPRETGRFDKNRKYILDYLSLLKEDNESIHNIVKQCVSIQSKKRPTLDYLLTEIVKHN